MRDFGFVAEAFIPLIAITGGFLFVIAIVWLRQRRREREAYYRFQLSKQLAERSDFDEQKLVAVLEQHDRSTRLGTAQRLRIGGIIALSLGIGLIAAFAQLEREVWRVGLVPAMVGIGLLVAGFFVNQNNWQA